MQQPLCHVYFTIVLEDITSDKRYKCFKPSDLVIIIKQMKNMEQKFEQAYTSVEDPNEKETEGLKGDVILIRIEIMAVIQRLIQIVIPYFNPHKQQGLGEIQSLMNDINK